MRKASLATLLGMFVVVFMCATQASAAPRTIIVNDPVDAPPTISGIPDRPDIKQVRFTFDPAGSFQFDIEFYNDPSNLTPSNRYAMVGMFSIGKWTSDYDECSSLISGQHHIWWKGGRSFYDRATVSGYSGYLELERISTEGGRLITIKGVHPGISDIDAGCFKYSQRSRFETTNIVSGTRYDEGCYCFYNEPVEDEVGPAYFPGYEPPPTKLTARELRALSVAYFDGVVPQASTKFSTTARCDLSWEADRSIECRVTAELRRGYYKHRLRLRIDRYGAIEVLSWEKGDWRPSTRLGFRVVGKRCEVRFPNIKLRAITSDAKWNVQRNRHRINFYVYRGKKLVKKIRHKLIWEFRTFHIKAGRYRVIGYFDGNATFKKSNRLRKIVRVKECS